MLTRFLALALCAAATPLHAQQQDSVYHGPGFDVWLPASDTAATYRTVRPNGVPLQVSVLGHDSTVLLVLRTGVPGDADTTLAGRWAMLRRGPAALMHAGGFTAELGDTTELVRDDRLTVRMPLTMIMQGDTARGTAEVSVPPRGPLAVWVVLLITMPPSVVDQAEAARVLDSFRLTGTLDTAGGNGSTPAPPADGPTTLGSAPPRPFRTPWTLSEVDSPAR
jgi:hypothetical protein